MRGQGKGVRLMRWPRLGNNCHGSHVTYHASWCDFRDRPVQLELTASLAHIKTAVDERLFLGKRPRSLELCKRCGLGCYPDAICDIVQCGGTPYVPLCTRSQSASQGSIRACASVSYARWGRTESIFDSEWKRYASLAWE